MTHDATVPVSFRTELGTSIKDALGSFWSSVYADQGIVGASVGSRIISLSQLHIDAMEALSLRDHTGMPVYHREHWLPLVIRLSQRNTCRGLSIGMPSAVVGQQSKARKPGHDYLEGEVFKIGGNALYSKVNTYPIDTPDSLSLVSVRTCICDSVSAPKHTLVPDIDFSIEDGVLTIRKEKDPFEAGGYRVIADGDDSALVMWACDALVDSNNVGDFMGYPLGIGASTSECSAEAISALWDIVVHGVTPRCLNILLGSLFGVDVLREDETVESLNEERGTGFSIVVTDKTVRRMSTDRIGAGVKAGAHLKAGSFLTDEITVYQGLSSDEVDRLVSGVLKNMALPRGSVLGVNETVVLSNRESVHEDGGWFKLNDYDSKDSPFWSSVFARTTADERDALFDSLVTGEVDGRPVVNPMRALGYTVLSNLILVSTKRPLINRDHVRPVFDMLCSLIPSFSRLLVVQFDAVDEIVAEPVEELVFVPEKGKTEGVLTNSETMTAEGDDVTFSFVPCAKTEV